MQTLVTGATGFVGAKLIPALQRAGHDVRAFARDPSRVQAGVPVVRGDATTGAGMDEAMAGVEVAYYLMHSMEAGAGNGFGDLERASVEHFVAAARPAGVPRAGYLRGPGPQAERGSPPLSRPLAGEEAGLAPLPPGGGARG